MFSLSNEAKCRLSKQQKFLPKEVHWDDVLSKTRLVVARMIRLVSSILETMVAQRPHFI